MSRRASKQELIARYDYLESCLGHVQLIEFADDESQAIPKEDRERALTWVSAFLDWQAQLYYQKAHPASTSCGEEKNTDAE